nr:MAG TPA: hypothetical protein [Caudoviricetes sp.]
MNPRTADPVRPLVALMVLLLVVTFAVVARVPRHSYNTPVQPAPTSTSTVTPAPTASATIASASDVLRPGRVACPASLDASQRVLPCSSPLWLHDDIALTSDTQHREVHTRAWTSHWLGSRVVGGEDLDHDGVLDAQYA